MLQEDSTSLIHVTAIKDPFRRDRIVKSYSYEGTTIQSYIEEFYPKVVEDFEVVASIDGRVVDPKITIPNPGSYVAFCLMPADFSDLGRMALMLGVIAFSIWLPGPGGWLATESAVLSGMITGATIMAGTLLINAILPPTPVDTDVADQKSAYGWSAVNIVEEGFTCPVVYGTPKSVPYLIGKYVSNEWVPEYDTPDKQRMNLLYLVADHSLDSIESIKINGNDYTNYTDISVQKRLGGLDQSVISNFRDTHTQQGYNIKFPGDPLDDQGVDWREASVPGLFSTGIGVGLSFPKGLGYIRGSGEIGRHSVHVHVQYRLQDESDAGWTYLVNGDFAANETSILRYHKSVVGLDPGEYKVRFQMIANTDEDAFRDLYLDYAEGIVEDDFRYPGASLLAINAMATDQLSGGLPVISCVPKRNFVQVHNGVEWVNKPAYNPAWACYDMFINDEYGAGVSYTRMVYNDFQQWADFCQTNGYECHIVFDTTSSFPEAKAKLEILGRGHVVQRGTNFGVIIDQAEDPVQLFTMGNIVQGTFKQSYLGKNSRANSVAITYFDAGQDYERLTFELRTSDFDTTGADVEKLELTLHGATSKSMAAKHGRFLLNCNEYLIRSVEFEVGVDALASNVGDVIYVSHDIPQWGYSGHVVSATSNTVTIDQEVTLTPGTTYHILVRHYDDDDLEEVELTTPGVETTTDVLNLSGTWAQTPQAEDIYAFGEITKVAKQFRITNITRAQEMTRKISALEYRSEVYSDSQSIPDYESETALYPYVEGLIGRETYKRVSGVMQAYVSLSWRGFGLHYLYMKEETANRWDLISTHSGDNWKDVYGLEQGKTYYFAVSTTANPADGEVISITFVGWTAPRIIWGVTGLRISGSPNTTIWQNRDLKLEWNLQTDTFPDEADDDPGGAGTFPPMTEFGGYRLRISDAYGKLRREVLQIENYYNYTYEKNSEDGYVGTIYFTSKTGTFTAGEWVYQANGAAAKISAVGADYLTLTNVTETFVSGQPIYQADYGSELVTNGNNESAVATFDAEDYSQDASYAQSNEQANGGTYSAKVLCTSTTYGSGFQHKFHDSNESTVNDNSFFIISADFYLPSGQTTTQCGWEVYHNGVWGTKNLTSLTDQWVTLSYIFYATNDFYAILNSGTTYAVSDYYYVDNISIKQLTNAALATSAVTFNTVGSAADPEPNLIIQVWARDKYGRESESPATISVSNPAPSAPSGLTATPHMKNIVFTWLLNTEIDFDYYKLRTKVETDDWSAWQTTKVPEYIRQLTSDEEDDHTSEAMVYIEVKTIDTFGNESSASSTNATTEGLNIQATDIDDFAITASKIFTKIPVLESDAWTDNSPSSGYVAWNTHNLYYNGVKYEIEAGDTDLKYIFWDGVSESYSSSDTNPTLTDGQFVIAVNIDGYHDLAWNAIANQVIGSAYIQAAAILDAHISSLDADKITTGVLAGIQIIGNLIQTAGLTKWISVTDNGITLHVEAITGKYSDFLYNEGGYGLGVLAYIHHDASSVPFYIAAEQTVADMHFYPRTGNPTGAAETGDLCVVNGKLMIYNSGWEVVGDQSAT